MTPPVYSDSMPVLVALLRGVNVGGHHLIRMGDLRSLCLSLGLRNPATYLQSGNVVFHAPMADNGLLATRLAEAIGASHGFRPAIVLRSAKQLQAIVDANPFAGRPEAAPQKLAVTFYQQAPAAAALQRVRALAIGPEELFLHAAEMYVFYPNGMGRSKFPAAAVDKILGTSCTARNWNTVLALLDMAVRAEAAEPH